MATVTERLAVLENEIKHLREDQEQARKESRVDRLDMKESLESALSKVNEQVTKTDKTVNSLVTIVEQAKAIRWFIGFVVTTFTALSGFGLYKLLKG